MNYSLSNHFKLLNIRVSLLGILLGYSIFIFPVALFVAFFFGAGEFGILVSYFAIFGSLLPIFVAFFKRDISYCINSISFFNISATWFLLLETVFVTGDSYRFIDRDLINLSVFYLFLFMFFVNFFLFIYYTYRRDNQLYPKSYGFFVVNNVVLFRIVLFCFFIPLFLLFFYYGSFSGLWDAMSVGRTDSGSNMLKSEDGASTSLMLPIIWLWQLVPALGMGAIFSKDIDGNFIFNFVKRLFLFFLVIFVIFITFLGGSRGALMFVAAPAIITFFVWKKNKSFLFWIGVFVVGVSIIGVMELQKRFRGNLLDVISNPSEAAQLKGYESITTFDITDSHRDNNMYLFALTVENVPYRSDFEGFDQFFVSILNPVPRAIWKSKPILRGGGGVENIPSYLNSGSVTLGTNNLTISVVGEAYLADGIFGIFVFAIFYSGLLYLLDRLVLSSLISNNPIDTAFIVICFFLAFWSMRGVFQMMTFAYPLILFLLFKMFFFKKVDFRI